MNRENNKIAKLIMSLLKSLEVSPKDAVFILSTLSKFSQEALSEINQESSDEK